MQLELITSDDPRRQDAEQFIARRFHETYGAQVRHFMPQLVRLTRNGKTIAVLGMRPATDAPLFLEHYLDRPVEQVLAQRIAGPIDRCSIVEIGNFADGARGSLKQVFHTLGSYLQRAGYRWVVFTGVRRICNTFARHGLEMIPLASADPARLTATGPEEWGTYYQHHPIVAASDIQRGYAHLAGHSAALQTDLSPASGKHLDHCTAS